MRGYFGLGQLSASEKQDILNQHKSLYNGYQTMQPQVSNTQPLYVFDAAGDKDGMVVNNKGEVKKYTNVGINEQVEKNEVCDECGAMIMDGLCECNYGHMEESEMEEGSMCEQCGGTMKEDVCEQCGSGRMEEETGHLDDIYKVRDLNLKKGDFDYVEGGGNDYGTFEGMHKNLYKEDDGDDFVNYDDNMEDDDDFEDYESSYTEDGLDDPDNEDDGFEDLNITEIEVDNLSKGSKYKYRPTYRDDYEDEIEFIDRIDYEDDSKPHFQFSGKKSNYLFPNRDVENFISSLDEQGGNTDDMDVDDVEPAYDFESNGPLGVYPVNEDDMYGYEPEKTYEEMESAWADEEVEVKEISNRTKRNALLKTMEKDKENSSNPFLVKKNLDQNRKFGQHIDPIIKREAESIAKMMGDNYSSELKKRSITNTDDKLVQKIYLDFYDGERLVSSIIITSEGDVDVVGSVPSNVERRLERFISKIKTHELDNSNNKNIDEQDVSGAQGIYGGMKKAYDFDSGGPGKGGPYQEFSYESELEEYDSEDDFGFATHSGDFGGDDSEEDDFGFATHSGDFGGDDSEEDEWEEIDVDMKESFIIQKNKISEMFNRLNKFN